MNKRHWKHDVYVERVGFVSARYWLLVVDEKLIRAFDTYEEAYQNYLPWALAERY